MKIELQEISIRELTAGYLDSEDTGVVGYDGRPALLNRACQVGCQHCAATIDGTTRMR